jgi:hypothetical protein
VKYISVICITQLQLFSVVYTGCIASWLTICYLANWNMLVFGTANNDFKYQLCDMQKSGVRVTVVLPCMMQHYLYKIHVLMVLL